jgi:hypothetical protein
MEDANIHEIPTNDLTIQRLSSGRSCSKDAAMASIFFCTYSLGRFDFW